MTPNPPISLPIGVTDDVAAIVARLVVVSFDPRKSPGVIPPTKSNEKTAVLSNLFNPVSGVPEDPSANSVGLVADLPSRQAENPPARPAVANPAHRMGAQVLRR